jgi:hypothetical protein
MDLSIKVTWKDMVALESLTHVLRNILRLVADSFAAICTSARLL